VSPLLGISKVLSSCFSIDDYDCFGSDLRSLSFDGLEGDFFLASHLVRFFVKYPTSQFSPPPF